MASPHLSHAEKHIHPNVDGLGEHVGSPFRNMEHRFGFDLSNSTHRCRAS